ncbi:TRAP transporter small permease [Chloroflexota bacterium]
MWLSKPAQYTESVINRLSRVGGVLVVFFLMSIMILIVTDVTLRYLFHAPIQGSVEITEIFMSIAGFTGLAWCAFKGGHVKVDLIVRHLPPRIQAITDSFVLLCTLSIIPLLGWQGFKYGTYILKEHVSTQMLTIPYFPFYMIMGLSFLLLTLATVVILVKTLPGIVKR